MLKKTVLALVLGLFVCLALLAVNGVIRLDPNHPTNTVSSTQNLTRWEPSGAAGSTWMHAWLEYNPKIGTGFASYTSDWQTSPWTTPVQLTAPSGNQLGDVSVAWDPFRSRFVMVGFDALTTTIWYAYSNSTGTAWTFSNPPPFPGGANLGCGPGGWDYPSVTVDKTGRVIVGAVYNSTSTSCGPMGPYGYLVTMSTDGATWPLAYNYVGPQHTGGAQSRVVAAGGLFEAFVPTLNSNGLPTQILRYESSDGATWTQHSLPMGSFTPPWNNTPDKTSGTIVFYAPLLAASGYTNGLWSVAFQALAASNYNNVILCTSDRGCGWANQASDDQFLVGTSVSGDSAYWVNYFTYQSPRNPPLIMQALYFPHNSSGIGATTTSNIQVTS